MRRVTVVLCVTLLLSIGLPAKASAASVVQTWSVGVEPFGLTVDPRDGKMYVAISNHSNYQQYPERMWDIDPSGPMGSSTSYISLPVPQIMSVLDTSLDRLFVTLTNGSLAIVDVATRSVVATVPNTGGPGIALDPATHRVYVSSFHGLAIVDGTSGAVLARQQAPNLFDGWWAVAHDAARHRVYVTNANYALSPAPSLVVLDDGDLSIIANIPLPSIPRLSLTLDAARGLLYVAGFSTGSGPSGQLYAIDTTSLEIVKTLFVGLDSAFALSTTLDAEHDRLYVSNVAQWLASNRLVVVDLSTFAVAQRIPLNTASTAGFSPGQSVMHPDGRLYVTGTSNYPGQPGVLAAITLVNSAPAIDSVWFSPESPTTNTLLTFAAPVRDPDGDALSITYEWRRNGVVILGANAATLDLALAGNGDRGDTLTARVTASDGEYTSTREASVVVGNALPGLSVAVDSVAPRTNDVLHVTTTTSDADGDALALSYAWSRNGVPIAGADRPTLDLATYGDHDDVLTVNVTADDGHGGIAHTSASATVADTPPTVTVSLSDTTPYTNDVLVATASGADADGDVMVYGFMFRVNGVATQFVGYSTDPVARFDLGMPGHGDRGDVITVEVAALARNVASPLATASANVVNSPPVVIVSLSSTSPTRREVLVATASASDADGDSGFVYTYSWTIGSKVRQQTTTTATSSSFDLSGYNVGDVVKLAVVATDGSDRSVPATASATISPR